MRFTILLIAIIMPVALVPAFAIPYQYFDLEKVELEIQDIQILSMDDTPGYYLDNSDLLKITINVTNYDLDSLILHDKMFKIWVMEKDFRNSSPGNEVLEVIDNYRTIYDDELEVIYDNLESRELFSECDYTNTRVRTDQSYSFTVCFDILRIWNNEILNIDGEKKYYLVMMDNNQATSCPNCKKIFLEQSSEMHPQYDIPDWAQSIFEWHRRGIVTDTEFENSIAYLLEQGIISKLHENQIEKISHLEEKNQELKEHQARLSLAQQTNLYVSAMSFYESNHSENFTGVLCKKQNNIVTLSGDYTNENGYYDAIFFKLLVFDDLNNVVATGLSKIIDVVPKEFSHFEVSTPYPGKINNCFVIIDYSHQS